MLTYLGMYFLCLRMRLQRSINSNISFCKMKIIFKSSTRLGNSFSFKDKIPLCLHSNIIYKFTHGRYNATYYVETYRHFIKVGFGEHSGISSLTNKQSKLKKKSTAVKEHMLICGQPVSFDDFKVLASINLEFHLKINESLLIWRGHLFWIKLKDLCCYICLISYTNMLQSYDYLVSPFIHCYLLFVAFIKRGMASECVQ